MVVTRFPRFLDDPKEYQQAETLWRERWSDLLRRLGQEWLWQSPWLSTSFADGSPSQDGNPIFSAVSPRLRRGVRVIQIEPSDKPRELYAWTDTFGEGEREPIKELVLTCVLTDQTLLDAVDLMKRWLTDEEADFSEEHTGLGVAPANPSPPPAGSC